MKILHKILPALTDGSIKDMEKFLNEQGDQGWELTFVKFRKNDEDLCVFVKRVKSPEEKKV